MAVASVAFLASAEPAATAALLYHGPRDERVVALTFDDDWSPPIVRQILGVLAHERIKATFFPVSAAVRDSPALWRGVLRAGHAIANHTINHPPLTMLSGWPLERQLVVSQREIRAATGKAASPYLRPPYGLFDPAVVRAASAAGFRAVVLWDVDARDWDGVSARQMIRNATRGGNGSIVVMHALPQTVQILPAIIHAYRHRGFRFVTVPQLLDRFQKPAVASRRPACTAQPSAALIAAGIAPAAGSLAQFRVRHEVPAASLLLATLRALTIALERTLSPLAPIRPTDPCARVSVARASRSAQAVSSGAVVSAPASAVVAVVSGVCIQGVYATPTSRPSGLRTRATV